MINSNWARWIRSSINKHFKDTLAGIVSVYFEGEDYDLQKQVSGAEILIDGPTIDEQSINYFRLDVSVQIPVVAKRVDTEIYTLDKLTGAVSAAFLRAIPAYKYGTDPLADSQAFLGCLMLSDENRPSVMVTNVGEVQADAQIHAAIVEGHYKIFLEG